MRGFTIAIMLVVAFTAGGTQLIAAEEVKTEVKVEEKAKVESEVASETEIVLTPEEFEKCRVIYFDRCAGCHGVLRKGATGPDLTPGKTKPKGSKKLREFIWFGTGGGMPGWGKMGTITSEETDLLTKYIQNEPPVPPQWDMKKVKGSWELLIPPDKRPTKPEHDRNVDNMFAVVLRDAGQIAIIDGDTKEVIGLQLTSIKEVQKFVKSIGVHQAVIDLTDQVANSVTKTLKKNEYLSNILKKIDENNYFFETLISQI